MTDSNLLRNLNISIENSGDAPLLRFSGGLADGILVKLLPETTSDSEDGMIVEYVVMTPPGNQAIKDEIEARLTELINLVLDDYIEHLEKGKKDETAI